MRILAALMSCCVLVAACAQTANREQVAQALRENPQAVFDALRQDKAQLLHLID
jgi:hypothetical protein